MRLREATAEDHAQVDAAFGAFDLSGREGYAAFLRAQAGAYLPLEAAAERAGAAQLVPEWDERRRADLLRRDLAELGVEAGEPGAAAELASAAQVLGAIYVLEGSKLGGRLLARGVPEQFPKLFIDAGSPRLWRSFLATLERALGTPSQIEEAIDAARGAFALFETSARRENVGAG